MNDSFLVTHSEAARILGRSVSTIGRAVKQGRLKYVNPINRLFDGKTLVDDFSRCTRPRVDRPINQSSLISEWTLIAQNANEMLEPSLWGPPPWSADRWAALAGVIDIARGDVC